MRSKRAELEQAVIRAAHSWANPTTTLICATCNRPMDIWWDTSGGRYIHDGESCGMPRVVYIDHDEQLRQAVADLAAYLDTDLTQTGGYNAGSGTSENAAISYWPHAGSIRRRIIDEIRSVGLHSDIAGLTDDELERRLRGKHTTVSSARNYLVNAGWLNDSGFRRETSGRRPAIVWKLSAAAQQLVCSPEWLEAK